MSGPRINLDAEHNLLAALLQEPKHLDVALHFVAVEDFYEPRGQAVISTMLELDRAGNANDPRRILDDLRRQGNARLVDDGKWLLDLIDRTAVVPQQVPYYALQVAEAAQKRRVHQLAVGVMQRLDEPDAEADAVLGFVDEEAAEIRKRGMVTDRKQMGLSDLVDRDNTLQWVIPGLLARHDRIILAAAEGWGKSLLTEQVAVGAAAGIHPFTFEPIVPQRVMIVDCENDADTVTERAGRFLACALTTMQDLDPSTNIDWVEEPGGFELDNPREAARLSAMIDRFAPSLVVIGPLYRLTDHDLRDEEASRQVIAALDRIRLRSNCALLMEAHVGNENADGNRPFRPYGSSIWRRWAGVGLSLKPVTGLPRSSHVYALAEYRGKRSRRDWPEWIGWGERDGWPWVPISFDMLRRLREDAEVEGSRNAR